MFVKLWPYFENGDRERDVPTTATTVRSAFAIATAVYLHYL